jgi:NTE family protein
VLGGGGITGIAWEIGILAGLADVGIDLTTAETVLGTSAGSVVGALVTGGDSVEELYASQLADAADEAAAKLGGIALLRYAAYLMAPGGPRRKRARIGRAAMRARTGVDEAVRIRVIHEGIGDRPWPRDQRLLITGVNAESGADVVFDRDSHVGLVSAVAASCAVPLVWPPITIDGQKYVDGGMRSPVNADLAQGAERVVVLAPITSAFSKSAQVKNQLARLGPGVRSVVVSPDSAAKLAIGKNMLDPAQRAAAARAGREQARSVVDQVAAVWS